ncbi:MAG: phenylalanyl-tRNA synthetase, beta subunit [Chthoniobacteraceae bacterium]|nr:phenylalanyl-tRNA synthetase, beta subunit [Chthoniobacteraceae bacterium]
MKVSLNWLRELVELPATVDALVELLTLAGVEVEGIETHGVAIPNVVVGQILESVQHPNADRLSVCQVDDGSGAPRQIVCGAKNYKVGDKVPVALPGAVLPGDFKIKVGKLRGVESQGMMCSADELGLPKGEDGLLILPAELNTGTPIADLYPGDTILDLEITPNRPDLLSVNGIAREIGALTAKPIALTVPELAAAPVSENVIEVEDIELCPLYSARTIRGVKVGPSPAWLCKKLESVGLRPINNIVDITNLVMLELGQPLHAFDAAKLTGPVQVRLAQEGEQFLALNAKTYPLNPRHLVIADSKRVLAIAGVMGGEESGVTESTETIVLESAYFQPRNIRRTSRELSLSSDSSYRFERGVDPGGVLVASQRATELIRQLAGGEAGPIETGAPVAVLETPPIGLRQERITRLLGVEVSPDRVNQILTGFGLTKSGTGWSAPSFRSDLTREVDLIEEIARVIGMEIIPARTQARFAAASATDRAYDRAMTLRAAAVAQGLHEARSLTLVPAIPLGVAFTQIAEANLQRVKNPMIDDQVVLRPNLLHGLLKAVRDNIRAGAKSIRLFEIGRVFSNRAPEEFSHFAAVVSGPISERSWRGGEGSDADLYFLKGLVTSVLGKETTFEPDSNPALALALKVNVAGKPVGFLGQLWPADARNLDATAPVLFAEVDLGAFEKALQGGGIKRFREVARFPAVTRDIALVAPLDVKHAAIEEVLRAANEPLLTHIELFDIFTDPSGVKLAVERKSLAYSLTYRSSEKTLTADEVNAAHGRLKERLQRELKLSLRE